MQRTSMVVGLVCALALVGTAQAHTADLVHAGEPVDLSGLWLFHAGDNPAFARTSFEDGAWEQRQLPSATAGFGSRWRGYGWYRRHIVIDRDAATDLLLTMGPARVVVEVYVNGSLVVQRGEFGSRPRGAAYLAPLKAWVPSGLLHTGDNIIALRVFDPTMTGGVVAGPLWLGTPDLISPNLGAAEEWALGVHFVLALVALCIGLGQLAVGLGRRGSREAWWLAGAATSLAVYLAEGTGLLDEFIPSVELTTRLPHVAGPVAVLCLSSFFASRYGDNQALRVSIGQTALALFAAALLLGPDVAVFWTAAPLLFIAALITTLYGAHLVAQAARRQERHALPVFASLVLLALLIVYDGLTASLGDMWPATSAIGAVCVLIITVVVGARQAASEHERVVARMLQVERRLEGHLRLGLLEATALSITELERFLEAAIQEAARDLAVRRCSLVLARGDTLQICAAVGLPRHVARAEIAKVGTIAGWVFSHGRALTPATLPEELLSARRGGNYHSEAFISFPVIHQETVLGVINVSDRHDGGTFAESEEQAVAKVAEHVALVLTRLAGTMPVRPRALPLEETTRVARVPELVAATRGEDEKA